MPRSSFVAWRGPSELDGQPVMVVIVPDSTNSGTGPMWQAHILRDDMSPAAAIAEGADVSICGGCVHRGKILADGTRVERSCYVVYAQGPQSTWRANQHRPTLEMGEVLELLSGVDLRIGAYGDPAAVPLQFWRAILPVLSCWTAYTHQWPDLSERWAEFCMASVDSPREMLLAWIKGWRTFRVTSDPDEVTDPGAGEIQCPKSRDVNRRQCIDCRACNGTAMGTKKGRTSIVILGHGNGAKYI